jgi:hypothetical protein
MQFTTLFISKKCLLDHDHFVISRDFREINKSLTIDVLFLKAEWTVVEQ